jgi:GDP-4-dehydro-6-deoxy-D-mannose reductase
VNRRVLITGISGFAGGFLAEHSLDCGDTVLGVSFDGRWEPNSSPRAMSETPLVAWDLGQSEGLHAETRRQIEDFRPDCIYHLAALSIPDECGQDEPAARAKAINIEGTRRVLKLAAALPSHPRVVVISSSHVYALAGAGCRIDETAAIGPTRGYGMSKWAAEEEVRHAIALDGVDAVIVRPFQHAGPRQNAKMMLSHWAQQVAVGGSIPVEVYTRNAWIDLSDVRDVVRAYRLLAELGRCGEVYNVGSGVSRRSGEVLDLLLRIANSSRPVVELRPGHKQDSVADVSRLRHLTGWKPNLSLETTVADTLAWWQSQM